MDGRPVHLYNVTSVRINKNMSDIILPWHFLCRSALNQNLTHYVTQMNLKCKKTQSSENSCASYPDIYWLWNKLQESQNLGQNTGIILFSGGSKNHHYMSLTDLLQWAILSRYLNCSTLQFATHLAHYLSYHKQEFRKAKGVWSLGLKKTFSSCYLLKYEGAWDDLDQTVESQEWADKNFMEGRPMWSGWRRVLWALVQGTSIWPWCIIEHHSFNCAFKESCQEH